MDEASFRRFQAIAKVVTTAGAVVVFFFGIHRYHVEQAQLIESQIEAEKLVRDREFRREIWLRQLETLSAVARSASQVAASVAGPVGDFSLAVYEFETLYWGSIIFVEHADMVPKMDALRNEIRYFLDGLEPRHGLSAADKVKQRAYEVALACRLAIQESARDFVDLSPPHDG